MIRARGKLEAPMRGLRSRGFAGILLGDADRGIILPAQDRSRSRRSSQNPGPVILGDRLIGLATQLLERGEYSTQDDLDQGCVLPIDLDVLFDDRQEASQCYVNRVGTGGKRIGGKTSAIVREKPDRRGGKDRLGSDQDGSAHLRRAGWVEDDAG